MKKNRKDKVAQKQEKMERLHRTLQGKGLFIFRNASKVSDLTLPKPANDGRKVIEPFQEFQGDDYFMHMLKTHEIRLVQVLIPPDQERKVMSEEKLILNQPETYTNEGKVELVRDTEKILTEVAPTKNCHCKCKCNEVQQNVDVLLTEDPLAGVDIL